MLARKSLLSILTNVVGAALGLAGLLAIARFMPKEVYGQFTYALGLLGLFVFISRLGYDAAHTKRISEGRDLPTTIGTFTSIKGALTLAFAVTAALGILTWHHVFGFVDVTVPVLFVMLAYYSAMTLRGIPEYTFTGLRMVASLQVMVLVEHLAKFPLLVMAALLYGHLNGHWVPLPAIAEGAADLLHLDGVTPNQGALWITGAAAVAMFASLAAGFLQMRHHDMRFGPYDRGLARSYTTFAMPIALVSALNIIAYQLDAVMIGFFWGPGDVADYGAAQRITSLVLIIPLALKGVFFPTVSALAARGEHNAVRTVARDTQRYMSLVMVLATMFLVLYASQGIHVFVADKFLSAAPVLRFMALATLMVGFMQVTTSTLMGYDAPRWVAAIGIVSVAVNVSLNIIFIPDSFFGIPMLGLRAPGAALATLGAYSVLLVLSLYAAWRKTGWLLLYPRMWTHLVAALATAGILHLLDGTFLLDRVDRWWELGLAGMVGTLLYVGLLVALREVGRKDLALAIDLLSPGKMGTYVRDELRGPR